MLFHRDRRRSVTFRGNICVTVETSISVTCFRSPWSQAATVYFRKARGCISLRSPSRRSDSVFQRADSPDDRKRDRPSFSNSYGGIPDARPSPASHAVVFKSFEHRDCFTPRDTKYPPSLFLFRSFCHGPTVLVHAESCCSFYNGRILSASGVTTSTNFRCTCSRRSLSPRRRENKTVLVSERPENRAITIGP